MGVLSRALGMPAACSELLKAIPAGIIYPTPSVPAERPAAGDHIIEFVQQDPRMQEWNVSRILEPAAGDRRNRPQPRQFWRCEADLVPSIENRLRNDTAHCGAEDPLGLTILGNQIVLWKA